MKFLHVIPLLMVLTGPAAAAPNDWAEGTPGKDNGATRDYYNRAGLLEWKNKMGDWRDAKNAPQGDDAYALADVAKAQKDKFVEWDVTALVQEWKSGTFQDQGFFLRVVNGKGVFQFASREHEDSARRPQIVLTGDKGTVTLMPQADTYLEASTVRSLGNQDHLKISNRPNHALLRFDPRGGKEIGKLTKAVLRLFNTTQTSGASASIGVFRCQQSHDVADTEPIFGLAAKYPGDHGIGKDPSVVFSTGFEAAKMAGGMVGGCRPQTDRSRHVRPDAEVCAVSRQGIERQSWQGRKHRAQPPLQVQAEDRRGAGGNVLPLLSAPRR